MPIRDKAIPSDDTDAAIEISGVVKEFGPVLTIGKPDSKSLEQVVTAVFGRQLFRSGEKKVYSTSFGQHRFFSELSLCIQRGKITALVGPSGSGKSVLLRLMSGIMPIDSGRIEINGLVASLLELGENLQPGWTIWENVELFGRLTKLNDKQIRSLYENVIAFSELSDFEEVPIRFFSTGMQMRVSVAIILMCNADILLIDDVLQVGDLAFQEKCMNRLGELKADGKTMILVVQDELQLIGIADRLLRLNRGVIVGDEMLDAAGKQSIAWGTPGARFKWHLAPVEARNDFISVRSVKADLVEHGKATDLRVCFTCALLLPQKFRPLVDVRHGAVPLFRTLYDRDIYCDEPGVMEFSLDLPVSIFGAGTFMIDLGFLSVANGDDHGLKTRGLLTLEVGTEDAAKEADQGPVRPDLRWVLSTFEAAT